ncbi:signal transduction histidine kinase [Microbacterium terrae]|uniref:histidine kinase n=1 Tax=Microbacterium terrae TaxID=69369 RepID=A0A0M2H4E9_9MICO|nr:histidine kinase [Microbacterium terrae]KJL38731.1 Signal transduction histidine-protein kinase/phosphatase DegS [Microbacterium terrae]MBP1076150.1 signal transduction histidine kinase [Microbacterium terrae]GLJ96970.1 hypothetical protein GCM10017594_01670 [Microbacterium terrae]
MEIAVAVLIQAVYWPLAAVLVWRAVRRRAPMLVAILVAVLLAAGAIAALDPMSEATFSRVPIGIGNATIAVLLAVFPDGRAVPRWILIPAALEVGIQVGNLASGLAWENRQPWWPIHFAVLWTVMLLAGQLYRYLRRSSIEERTQARWPLLGMITVMLGFLVWMVAGAGGIPVSSVWVANLLNAVLAPTFAIGLLAPRTAPVDLLLAWVITGGLWLIAVGSIAAASVKVFDAWIPDAAPWLAAMVSATGGLLLAIVARWIGRRTAFGRLTSPVRAVAELGDRLGASIDPRDVPRHIVDTVTDALHLRGVRVASPSGLHAHVGEEPLGAEAVDIPIRYAGLTVGTLTALPRLGDAALTPRDRATLERMCRQAGPALHNTQVLADLLDARSQLVFAREEERKRLRRDLHDDLAPTFSGLGLSAAAVEAFARAGDERAAAAAARLVEGFSSASRQLRDVAYDLRPPVLDDRGLVEAIRERVGSTEHPVVTVEADTTLPALPAAIEAAAFRIAQEAVANVKRHASASHCVVSVASGPDALRIVVTDDGRGIAPESTIGVGIQSMRERTDEVGGTLTIDRPPAGGTRVVADLPLLSPTPVATMSGRP